MDALYVFRHSRFNDIEIRYSLRSIARYMPWVRKVWIFGDRPAFLTDDTSIVEHVPQRYVARIGDFQTPVTNFFQMLFLFTRKRIFEAWCDFQDFTSQDRWFGMLGPTAILNHALKHDRFALTNRGEMGSGLILLRKAG